MQAGTRLMPVPACGYVLPSWHKEDLALSLVAQAASGHKASTCVASGRPFCLLRQQWAFRG
jgi:hypothetical protein